MSFKFFTVPIHDTGSAEAELNGFLSSHKILSVDRRWVDQGSASFWSFCVDYLASANNATNRNQGSEVRNKVDYKEILSPDQFSIFAKLRDLRKELAQAEAVPVYMVFTNEQLAQMVQTRVTTKADLEKVAGVGDARIEKYGERVLQLLTAEWKSNHEKSGASL